jgi:hypothetical protein
VLSACGLQQTVQQDGKAVVVKAGTASIFNHTKSFGRYLSHDRDVYDIEPTHEDHGDGMGNKFRFRKPKPKSS